MPTYRITAPDGKTYQIDGPAGASQEDVKNEVIRQHPYAAYTTEELKNAPTASTSTADFLRQVGQGGISGAKSLTDLFGAGNDSLSKANEYLEKGLSPQLIEEQRINQELQERAKGKGILEELSANLRPVFQHPFTSTGSAIASSVPMIAGSVLAEPLGLATAAELGIGSLMGLGGQKGQNYQNVHDEAIKQGKSEQEAEALGQQAAEYSVKNLPSLAAGALSGALEGPLSPAAKLGRYLRPGELAEGAIKNIPKPTFARALGTSALESGLGEFVQGSAAQLGSNLALQNAGFDTPLMEGVMGAGAHDALIGALTGAAVSPAQLSSLKREYDADQAKILTEEAAKKQKESADLLAKFNEQNQINPELLALPAPAPKVEGNQAEQSLFNPHGNYTAEELGPERVAAIDAHRADNGKPPLKSYSIEDIVDAMPSQSLDPNDTREKNPAGERADLNALIANKVGHTNEKVTPQDVVNKAIEKNVDPSGEGFKDFLRRTTGIGELNMMTDGQRFAAQQALQKMEPHTGEAPLILPRGTTATHYDADQRLNSINALDQLGGNVSQEKAIETIKKATGLQRDQDAQHMIADLVRSGDFDLNKDNELEQPSSTSYLPSGYHIEEGSFKEGEAPEHFKIMAGDKELGIADTQEAAEEKKNKYLETRAKKSDSIDKEIEEKQAAVQKSKDDLEAMEAMGQGRTPEYQKASGDYARKVSDTEKEIGNLNRTKAELDPEVNPLSIKAGNIVPKTRKGFTIFKNSQSIGTFPDRSAAEKSIAANLSTKELEQLTGDKRRRSFARLAEQELNDRVTPGIKVRVNKEFEQAAPELGKQLEAILAKFGLKGVGLKLMSTLGGNEGEYAQSLIKIALDITDPIGVLRHESVHALKALGFFTDNQWNALRRMAKDKWIKEFLKDKPFAEGKSRYDAYMEMYKGDMNAIEEEAIADAFRYYAEKGSPPGMIAALLKRLNQFFEALRNVLTGNGFNTAEDIFEKIEKGQLVKAEAKPAGTKASIKTAKWAEKEEAPDRFGREDVLRQMYRKLNDAYTEADSPDEAYDLAYKASTPPQQRILRALKKDDFLGFDYPHQAIREIVENPENYDLSTPLKVALSVVGNKGTKASLKTPLSTREIMEQNDQFAQAELGLNTEKAKGKTGVNNVRDIAKALNAQTVGEEGAMNRLSHTVKDEDRIAKAMADEVGYQLRATAKTGTGLGWYSNNYPNAVKMLSRRFPELENNKHARSVFSALVAVTSNGERVAKNIDNAIKLYSKLRDGKPLVAMGNRRASALDKNLINIENLLRKYGADFEKELLKEITVKDMNAYLRSIGEESDASYLANTVIPSAAIHFGPKLGAFYANLSGSEGYLTMDLWWTRSINRMRGLLIPKATKASLDKFREMLDMPDASVNDLVEESIPLRNIYEENGFVTDLEFLAGGKEPAKKVLKEAWFKRAEAAAGDAYDQFLFEHNLLKMANTIYKNEFEMLEEAPFSATDRAFMYKAARKAQALLRGEGVDLTLADIQAALWYYEKRLYAKLSGRKADDIGYEEAIIKQANQGNRSVRPSVVFTGQQNGGNVSTGAVQLSGQPSSATVKASLKGIVAEVAPNPDQEVAARWRLMNSADKQQTTEVVARRVIPKLFDDMGFKGWSYNISSGRYEGEQNPNIIINAPDSATDEELNEFARVIGNVFDQKAMVTYDEDNTTSDSQNGFVSVIIPEGMNDKTLNDLREHISKEVPEANADTVRNGKIHFGNFSKYTDNEISDEQYYNNIKDAIANFDYDGIIDVQKPIRFHSELIEPANREEYLEGTRYGTDQGSREKAGGDDLWRQGRNRLEAISEDAIQLRNKWIESGTKSSESGRVGATTFPNVEAEYGTPIENASSAVGVHFSKQKRNTLISKFFGTGLKGLEGERLSEPANRDIKDRIYFYVDKGKGIVPEAGVGGAAHVVRLNNLYDAVKDPLGIIKTNKGEGANERASNLERKIKNAGFDGYMFMDPLQNQGYAVLIGKHNISVPPSKASLKAHDTPAFKRFFGDSKVLDKAGKPMVMYHATNADFNTFRRSDDGKLGEGIYSTSIPEYSNEFAPEGNIMPLYAHAENPFVINVTRGDKALTDRFSGDINKAMVKAVEEFTDGKTRLMDLEGNQVRELFEKNGYDGIMVKDDQGNIVELNVFTPNQLKSAIGNKGTYDFNKPDIRASLGTLLNGIPNAAGLADRLNTVTPGREDVGFARRMIEAINPKNFGDLRINFLNRYNQMAVHDKMLAKAKGVVKLMADASAESAALMSDLASGIAAEAMSKNGGVPVYKNGYTSIDRSVKSVVEIFAPLAKMNNPDMYRLYQFWAGAKRARRLIREGREENYTSADLQHAKELEKKYGHIFNQVHDDWIKYNNGLVKYLVDTGVLSPEKAKEFSKYSDYIPFYRQIDGDTTVGPQLFQSLTGVKAPKKLKGGEGPLADLLETVVRNTHAAIQSGTKNVAATRAVKNAEELKLAEKVPFKQDNFNTVKIFENGKESYYNVADPLLIQSMQGLNLPDLPFLGILSAPANWLRNMVTKDPGFMLANMMKDSISAYITSGSNMTPVVDTVKHFTTAMAGTNPTIEKLRAAGIGGGHLGGNIEVAGRDLAKKLRKEAGTKTTLEKGLTPFTSLWDALEHGTEASDLATRAAIFEKTMAETGNEAEAIYQALEVMNFYRKGANPIIRILSAVTPFLNARIQGLDVFYRAGFAPFIDKNATEADKARQKAFFVRGATIMALSAAYWIMTHDDDDYKKQEQETRDNNWLIPSLGVKIPIPFEVGFIFKVFPERVLEYLYGNDTGKDFRQSMRRGITSTLSIQAPQIFQPALETMTNYSFFTGRAIVPQGLQNVAPEYQVGPSTTKTFEAIGKELGQSPIMLEHLWQGYTGTMGMYMVDAIDSIINLNSDVPKASKRFEQMPFIKRFALDPEARGSVSSYYDLKDSVDQAVRTSNLLEKTGNYQDIGEYMQENAGLLATDDYVKSMDKSMKDLQNEATIVRSSGMSADEKRDALKAIGEAQNALTANVQYLKKMMSER